MGLRHLNHKQPADGSALSTAVLGPAFSLNLRTTCGPGRTVNFYK